MDSKKRLRVQDIFIIVEEATKNERNTMFICDKEVAGIICDWNYLENKYGYETDEESLLHKEGLNEYYITLCFNDGKKYYCENARGINGEFKEDDCGNMDYYIFLEMTEKEIAKKLLGNGNIYICELLDDISEYEEDETFDMLQKYTDEILEAELCPSCIFNIVMNIYESGKRDSKIELIEQLANEVDSNDENLGIDHKFIKPFSS